MSSMLGGVRVLRELGAGPGGRVVIVSATKGPWYAGAARPAARTLLEAALTFLTAPAYREITLFTGSGSHLPELELGSVKVGVIPAAWLLRAGDEGGRSTGPVQENEDPDLPCSARVVARLGARSSRILFNAQAMPWPERTERLLRYVEEACGGADSGTAGRKLVVVDGQYLLPEVRCPDERDVPSSHKRRELGHRFGKLAALCRGTNLDLVFVCSTPQMADGLAAGELIARVASSPGDDGASARRGLDPARFPELSLDGAARVEVPSMAGKDPHGPFFPGAPATMRLYEVMRRVPPVPPVGPLEELDRLVGLEPVKQRVRELAAQVAFEARRQAGGLPTVHQKLNTLLLGFPGTGKTTVARILGRVLHRNGLLPGDGFLEVSRADLVGRFIGDTAANTRQVCQRALGGVLFIDEAYSLSQGGEQDFGKEAVTELISCMDNHPGELVVILAGYPSKMQEFLRLNDGLARRLPFQIRFPEYTAPELLEVARRMAAAGGDRLEEAAEPVVTRRLKTYRAACDAVGLPFGNAGVVENLLAGARMARALRLSGTRLGLEDLVRLTSEDLERAPLDLPLALGKSEVSPS